MHIALWLNSEMHVKIVFLFIITAGILLVFASPHFSSSTYSLFLPDTGMKIDLITSQKVVEKISHNL